MARPKQTEEMTRSYGSVFEDLGFENPGEMRAKADLVIAISRVMEQKKLTQAKLALAIGIDQPSVSRLLRGRTVGYSVERLMRILNQLGQDVEITVRPAKVKSAKFGQVWVHGPEVSGIYVRRIDASATPAVRESKSGYGTKRKE